MTRSALAALAALGIFIAGQHMARPARAFVPPYDTCIEAANTPGPSGFATEVCEPLMPGWVER